MKNERHANQKEKKIDRNKKNNNHKEMNKKGKQTKTRYTN